MARTGRQQTDGITHTEQLLHLITTDAKSCEKWVTSKQPPIESFPKDLKPLVKAISDQWLESGSLITRISLRGRIENIGLAPVDKAVVMSKWSRCCHSISQVKPCDYETILSLVQTEVREHKLVAAGGALVAYMKDPSEVTRQRSKQIVDAAFNEKAKPFELVTLSDVEAKTVEWLWPNRIPLGTPVVIAGSRG